MFSTAEARVLTVLSQAGVFRAGGVLVGSFAFRAYGQIFGRSWASALTITNDIDIASVARIGAADALQLDKINLRDLILKAEPGFVEVPALNRHGPSTKFSTRGQNISVEMLTPMLGPDSDEPVLLRNLGTYATPLRFLDYLITGAHKIVLAAGEGVEVNVADAARFAVHKLVVAERRRGGELAKINKDIAQAAQVFTVLLQQQPALITEALSAAKKYGGKFWQQAKQGGKRLPPELQTQLRRLGFK